MTKGTEDYQSSSKQLEKDLRYLANMYNAGTYIDRYAIDFMMQSSMAEKMLR